MIRVDKKTAVPLAVAAAVVAAAAIWLHHESSAVTVREIRVNLPYFSAADDGLSAAVLSDTHFSSGDAARAEEISRIVAELAPDMIFLLGDFVNGTPDPRDSLSMEELTRFAASLHAKYGVFAVTGNKEMWYGRDKVVDALRRGGVKILSGKTCFVALPSGRLLQLAGFPDHTTECGAKPPAVVPQTPTVALMHDARSAASMPEHAFGVAGHTHGGQFRLIPNGGNGTSLRLFVLRLKKKLGMGEPPKDSRTLFDRGFTSYKNRKVFITSGLGGERVRVRMFCPPEIVLMRLFAADERASKNRYNIPEEL